MRRTRLRAALLIVVAAAIAGIGWQVSRGVYSQKVRTVKDLGRDFLPKVAQHIRQYYEKHDQVVVHEPLVTFYMKDGRRATVAGTEGRLTLKEHELSAFTLSGAVKVDLNGLELTTDQAVYDREHDLITAPGPIVLRGDTLDVYGTGLEIRVTPQQFHVLSNVRTVLKNNNKSNAKAS